jgi:anti-anti-sigma regulatory factor
VFSSAVKDAVRAAGDGAVQHLVVDMEAVTDVDVTGAESFAALKVWLHDQSVSLAFSRVRPNTQRRLRELELLVDEPVYATNRAAILHLDPANPSSQDDSTQDPSTQDASTQDASAERQGS